MATPKQLIDRAKARRPGVRPQLPPRPEPERPAPQPMPSRANYRRLMQRHDRVATRHIQG